MGPASLQSSNRADSLNIASPDRSNDFWFDDGSVVLHVESTQFRVHRSMLSANSEVFRGMFALPQPAAVDRDLVEGCPVVHLPDQAVDWTHVLRALYNGRRNDNFGDTGWPFPVVAAYLRLGSKYEIEHLHTEAMDVLSAGFPSTLEENDVENYNDGVGPLVFEKSMYFDVISLARETGIHRLLPAAYCYYCEMFVLDEVLEGIERVDGTLSVLSAQDQKVLMRGWHTLVRLQSVETFYWMTDVEHDDSDVFAGCETTASGKCALARRDIMCEEMFPMRSDCVALRCWDSLWETRMCKACIAVCTDIHDEGRARIWDKLPSVFGLPAWNELF